MKPVKSYCVLRAESTRGIDQLLLILYSRDLKEVCTCTGNVFIMPTKYFVFAGDVCMG